MIVEKLGCEMKKSSNAKCSVKANQFSSSKKKSGAEKGGGEPPSDVCRKKVLRPLLDPQNKPQDAWDEQILGDEGTEDYCADEQKAECQPQCRQEQHYRQGERELERTRTAEVQ